MKYSTHSKGVQHFKEAWGEPGIALSQQTYSGVKFVRTE